MTLDGLMTGGCGKASDRDVSWSPFWQNEHMQWGDPGPLCPSPCNDPDIHGILTGIQRYDIVMLKIECPK